VGSLTVLRGLMLSLLLLRLVMVVVLHLLLLLRRLLRLLLMRRFKVAQLVLGYYVMLLVRSLVAPFHFFKNKII